MTLSPAKQAARKMAALQASQAETAALGATVSGKQARLVSGTNIKTVNGTSLLGSGDLVVSGGGGSYQSPLWSQLA